MTGQVFLTQYATAIESWANASDKCGARKNAAGASDVLCLKTKDNLSNINTWDTKCKVVALVNESFRVTISRSSELGDRYRIVNAAARVLGLDHVVVARAAKVLSRDAFRFSRMT